MTPYNIHEKEFKSAVADLTIALSTISDQHRDLTELLDSIGDCIPGIVFAKDTKGRYIYANDEFVEWIGAASKDVIHGTTDFYWGSVNRGLKPEQEDFHTFGAICANSDEVTLKLGRPCIFLEYGAVRGFYQYLHIHKAPLYNYEKKLIGIVGCGFDVTERILKQENAYNKLEKIINTSELKNNNELTEVLLQFREIFDRHKFTDRTVK